MNRIACGIVIGVLAVMVLSPPALPRIVAHLREMGERIMAELQSTPVGNRALSRSITAERKELDNRVTAFNEWKAHRECNADTAEYRDFLKETGRNAPVVDCN